ncbi:MAG: helix-turn-helix transcriptional regulator [Bacteroidales bacterium]|nr:helix-turn-helix transcriptional regulator [Bacteroidales bacterium]
MADEITPEKVSLTRRELDVLRLLAKGYTSTKIAESLGLKPPTVMWYRKRLHKKFKVHNMAGLLFKAMEQKIL